MSFLLELVEGIYECLRIRRPTPPSSVGLDRGLLGSSLNYLASQPRPFGFDSQQLTLNEKDM